MAATDPLTGARYPQSTDGFNPAQDIQNAVNDLSGVVGGIYTSTSTRDSAFSAWVSAGGAMKDGLRCTVGGYQQVYRGGSWHGASPIAYSTTIVDTGVYTATHSVMTISVPDPGFPYKIRAGGQVLLATIGTGVTVDALIRVNGTAQNPAAGAQGSANNVLMKVHQGLSAQISGASTVTFSVEVIVGNAPNYGFQATGNDIHNVLTADVMPA